MSESLNPWEALVLFLSVSLTGTIVLSIIFAFRDPWEALSVGFSAPFTNRFLVNQAFSSDTFSTSIMTVRISLSIVGLMGMAHWVLISEYYLCYVRARDSLGGITQFARTFKDDAVAVVVLDVRRHAHPLTDVIRGLLESQRRKER